MHNPRLYAVDYAKLFIDTIQPIISSIAPHTPFVDTSPSSGLLSSHPYIKRCVTLWTHGRVRVVGNHYKGEVCVRARKRGLYVCASAKVRQNSYGHLPL